MNCGKGPETGKKKRKRNNIEDYKWKKGIKNDKIYRNNEKLKMIKEKKNRLKQKK